MPWVAPLIARPPALGSVADRPAPDRSKRCSGRVLTTGYRVTSRCFHHDPSGHCLVDTVADVGFSVVSLGFLLFGPQKERGDNFTSFLLEADGILIKASIVRESRGFLSPYVSPY